MGNNSKERKLLPPRSKPLTGEIYHVYNRGVEKRKVFLNHQDRLRFIYSLAIFNNEEPTPHNVFRMMEVGLPLNKNKKLVEVLCFVLMNNHYHLMVRQTKDGGLTKFIRKLGTGYTNYFNLKYGRVGALFQGKYKLVHVATDQQLFYLPYYIHLNPIDSINENWFATGLASEDLRKAKMVLESFRWSSHLDYTGRKNFPEISDRTFLSQLLGGPEKYEREIFNWLKEEKGHLPELETIHLD